MRRSYAHLFCHKTFSFLGREAVAFRCRVYQRCTARQDWCREPLLSDQPRVQKTS